MFIVNNIQHNFEPWDDGVCLVKIKRVMINIVNLRFCWLLVTRFLA